MVKDQEVLLTFFDFPVDHWIHLKTTNAIESTFATVRLRTKVTKGVGIEPSVGSRGDSNDNAMAESTIGLYKTELIERNKPWKSFKQVEIATLAWIDWFNNTRLHGEIGYVPPVEFEQAYYRTAHAA